MVGLTIAGALGALGGNPMAGLEVLDGISPDIVELAQTFVNQGKVQVDVKYGVAKLYIECICFKGENSGRVIIQDRHTNILLAERNGLGIDQNTSK